MRQILVAVSGLWLTVTQPPAPNPAIDVKFEQVAEGVQAAQLFRTDALRGLIVEVKDIIVGPGKAGPQIPTQGFAVTELKSGAIETTIDGQTARRKPGDFWIVNPGQRYGIKSVDAMAVLHVVIFTKP
jgi:hypothetical protein